MTTFDNTIMASACAENDVMNENQTRTKYNSVRVYDIHSTIDVMKLSANNDPINIPQRRKILRAEANTCYEDS